MAKQNTTLEYLTTTKIGEKGQLTVPKQFREDLGLGKRAFRRPAFGEMVNASDWLTQKTA